MFKYSYLWLVFICTSSLTGCGASLFTSRETNPSIQDMTVAPHFWPWSENAINTFSTTASRRMVLVKSGKWGEEISSCAEPSPDVGETFASAISNAIKVAVSEPSSGINGELSNDYAEAIATQITPLVYRTQALQLYRDAAHNLCIDKMNGWYPGDKENQNDQKKSSVDGLTAEKGNSVLRSTKMTVDVNHYNAVKLYLFDQTIAALKHEVPLMIKAQTKNVTKGETTGLTVKTIKDIADAIKNANQITITTNAASTTIGPTPKNILKGK